MTTVWLVNRLDRDGAAIRTLFSIPNKEGM